MKRLMIIWLLGMLCIPAAKAQFEGLVPAPKRVEITKPHKMVLFDIQVKIDSTLPLPTEGYRLETKKKKAYITAKDNRGAIWAWRTLKQLVDQHGLVPQFVITDWPETSERWFWYWPGEEFVPVDSVKRQIDRIAELKFNGYLWELINGFAWRTENRSYPRLNDPEYSPDGKFYTYGEIQEIMLYADKLGVTVIPSFNLDDGDGNYFQRAFGFPLKSERGDAILKFFMTEFKELAEYKVKDKKRMPWPGRPQDAEVIQFHPDRDSWEELPQQAKDLWE